jgi:hypothetical protein
VIKGWGTDSWNEATSQVSLNGFTRTCSTIYLFSPASYHLQCNRIQSLDVFFQEVLSDPVKVALLGCGCSVATGPVAEISHQWNISHVSHMTLLYLITLRSATSGISHP